MERMTNAEYLRRLRAKAVAEGKCLVCRARAAEVGCKSCGLCLQKRRQRGYQPQTASDGDGWKICCQARGDHRVGCAESPS